MKDYLNFLKKNIISEYVNSQAEFWYWKKILDNVYNNESTIECWDYQWLYSVWNNHGFGIAPSVNLVKNIGFDNDATHTVNKPVWYDKIILGRIETIVHPDEISINQQADDYQFNTIIQPLPPNNILQKITSRLSVIKNRIRPKKTNWQDNEYFDPIWEERIKSMSAYLLPNDRVVDLGCGMMWLKKFLLVTNEYIPVDYKKRDKNTIVCDFNKNEFPDKKADVYFVSGCLEYIIDPNWFITKISDYTHRCVISYCTSDIFSNLEVRKNLMWKSHLSEKQLIDLFAKHGFHMKDTFITDLNNQIFYFSK